MALVLVTGYRRLAAGWHVLQSGDISGICRAAIGMGAGATAVGLGAYSGGAGSLMPFAGSRAGACLWLALRLGTTTVGLAGDVGGRYRYGRRLYTVCDGYA